MTDPTARIQVGDLELCYETFGNPDDPALLLVMGFGVQLTGWPRSFCRAFADAGFHVIRYDHRDIGRSSRIEDREPDLDALARGDKSALAYTLGDLADDGVGLVRALGIERVHVVGASMGGMIAQEMAIRHPHVVVSLCSIMSTTGAPDVGRPDPDVWAAMAMPAPDGRAGAIERAVMVRHLVSGGRYPVDEDDVRRRAAAAHDRSNYPDGLARHRIAVRFARDRTADLRRLSVPVLVIHGAADPLVSVTGGRATAAAIPGADLLVLPGMGHEFPLELEATIVEAVARNAGRAIRVAG